MLGLLDFEIIKPGHYWIKSVWYSLCSLCTQIITVPVIIVYKMYNFKFFLYKYDYEPYDNIHRYIIRNINNIFTLGLITGTE